MFPGVVSNFPASTRESNCATQKLSGFQAKPRFTSPERWDPGLSQARGPLSPSPPNALVFHDGQRAALVRTQETHPGADVLVVLVAALKVFHVSSEVGVDDAEAGIVEDEPDGDASLVSLQGEEPSEKLMPVGKRERGAWSTGTTRSVAGRDSPSSP